jgi:hypothetical protein
MSRKTKAPPTVAEVHALWRLFSADDQRKFRRLIDKRRSRWDKIDALMLLVYDLYRERYALPPTRYFKWIGALLDGGEPLDSHGFRCSPLAHKPPASPRPRAGGKIPSKIRFGQSHNAAWRRLYGKYKTGDYEKLARPAWFDDPKLIVLPPPSPSDADPRPPAIGYPPPGAV